MPNKQQQQQKDLHWTSSNNLVTCLSGTRSLHPFPGTLRDHCLLAHAIRPIACSQSSSVTASLAVSFPRASSPAKCVTYIISFYPHTSTKEL